MANSQIEAIYTALETMSVLVNEGSPTVYGLTGLPEAVETADLPCRILEIFDNHLSTVGAKHTTLAPNPARVPNMAVSWSLSDLMLFCPLAQGRGKRDVAIVLVRYCGAYLDAIRASEAIIPTASIEDVKPVPGVYEYPADSGNLYFGVLSVLSIKELIET